MPKVSVIIPTIKGREELLERLRSTIPHNCEVIIMDNEDSLLAEKRTVGGFRAKGDYLLFIDDDNYLHPMAITAMVDNFTDDIGVMGMTACYSDKKLLIADGGSKRSYLTGFTWGQNTNKRIYEVSEMIYDVDEVANAFMIKREVFIDAGGLDEHNFPIDLDEADICKRLKNMGYRVVMNSRAICYHKSNTYSHIPDFRRPMNAYYMGRNRILYQRKHLNLVSYGIYLALFMPIFVSSYCFCLILRLKPHMIKHFLKGVIDGLLGRRQNKY